MRVGPFGLRSATVRYLPADTGARLCFSGIQSVNTGSCRLPFGFRSGLMERMSEIRDDFRRVLENLPPKPPRSRLEPYRELIAELRARGRTYVEIVQILNDNFQVKVAAGTLHDFVRRRTVKQTAGTEAPQATPAGSDPDEEVRRRIAALKAKQPPDPEAPPKFTYDPAEPLRLLPRKK